MKFTLEIELGNDVMQTLDDVIHAVVKSKRSLADGDGALTGGDRDILWDENGNTVGRWEVKGMTYKNDYRLTDEDSKRITCTAPNCVKGATTGQNSGSAPFWYHCDEHAEMLRVKGKVSE